MEGEKLIIGIIIGAALAFLLMNRNTYTEVVRDEQGRIVQILEMSDSKPLFGRRMLNVSDSRPLIRITSET